MEPESPWSPGTFSLPKGAQKGKPRCNPDLSCAHQLSSCAIHLLMVTFRLSVAQRGEQWHHCIRQLSSGLHHVVFLVTQKCQRSVCYSYLLELYQTESLPLQPVLLSSPWFNKVLSWHQSDKYSLTSSCCL